MEFFADDSVVPIHKKFAGRLRNRTSDDELSETQSLSESEMERYRSKYSRNNNNNNNNNRNNKTRYMHPYKPKAKKKPPAQTPTVGSDTESTLNKRPQRSAFPSTRETEQSMAIHASRRNVISAESVQSTTPRYVIFFSLTRGDVRMFCHCFSITASS
jgi:hypothetical protein